MALLSELKARAEESGLDARSKELFADAFEFGIRNPLDLDFGVPHTKLVSPNAVGFQFVVRAIARRTRNARRKGPASIKIDRQQQFNKAQIETHDLLTGIAEGLSRASAEEQIRYLHHPLVRDLDPKDLQLKGMPINAPEVSSSEASVGLQIVDVYLWTTNRLAGTSRDVDRDAGSGSTVSEGCSCRQHIAGGHDAKMAGVREGARPIREPD